MKKVSIRVNILINFFILILIVTSLLLGIQYYSSYKFATSAANKDFQITSKNIISHIQNSNHTINYILNLISLNPNINSSLSLEKHPLLDEFIKLLSSRKNLTSLLIAYPNNDLYKIVNLQNTTKFKEKFTLNKQDRWAVVKIIDQIKYIQILDEYLHITQERSQPSDVKVTSRPYYIQSLKTSKTINTNTYIFDDTKQYGITFAKKALNSDNVISLDVTLQGFNAYIKSIKKDSKNSVILYDSHKNILATSDDITPSEWQQLHTFLENKKQNTMYTFDTQKESYFTFHNYVNASNKDGLQIAISISKNELLEPYIEKILFSIYVAIAFILLCIPLVLYSTSHIVKPILALMRENKKIINRKFDDVINIETNIAELHELSSSLLTMSKSIQNHQKSQEALLDSIIKLIAEAIDAKSAYTGGHCKRVPEIAQMLVKIASDSKEGVFKDFTLKSEDEWREFYIGSWLHDCGKVTTPEYVIDKSSKLETINNRIHEIRTRFEVLYRDAQIRYLQSELRNEDKEESLEVLHATQKRLLDEFDFIASSNIGGEFMDASSQYKIYEIAKQEWVRNFDDRLGLSDAELLRYKGIDPNLTPATEKLLSDKPEHIIKRENFDYEAYSKSGFTTQVPEHLYNYGELYNLCVSKGTLTEEERFKINEHVIMSIKMLEQLPFPPQLSKIPEYAGTHHETLIGTGYPRGLTKDELSIPARIMALADIFEALTASDRPYKNAKTLSESLKIMSSMVKDKHIDSDVFDLFLESEVYLEYAHTYLQEKQIDDIDIKKYTSS